jgi:hypothetical protein
MCDQTLASYLRLNLLAKSSASIKTPINIQRLTKGSIYRNHCPFEKPRFSAPQNPITMETSPEAFEVQPHRPAAWSGAFLPLTSSVEYDFDVVRTVKPGLLCSKCKPIASWVELNCDRPPEISIREIEFEHYWTGTELENQYVSGCHLCTLIWHSIIENDANYRELALEERLQVGWELSKWFRKGKNFWIFCHNPYAGFPGPPCFQMRAKFHLPDRVGYGAFMDVTQWPARTKDQLGSLDKLPASSTIISTASRSALQLASSWLEECVTTHTICQSVGKASLTLPKRLLKIEGTEGSERLKVVLTDETFSGTKYAALSYCWGGSQGYTLTSLTQKALLRGVKIQKLSRTIRDSINVTRNLGLKWLWVDSLCIIQDSNDWTREAASMVDVYQNCYVCIGATGARTGDEGLFANRDPLIYQPCQLTQRPEFEGGQMFVHPYGHPFKHFANCFENSALHKRAWVMQERILAPRTLNFGTLMV